MSNDLSFDLHALTARLDRSADRILQAEQGVSFRRFRTLLMVGDLGTATQRALAQRLEVSEPSVSRMTAVLVETGLIEAEPDPAGGNRRQVRLTSPGTQVVEQGRDLLERRFASLVARSGVSYADFARNTRRLLAALDGAEQEITP